MDSRGYGRTAGVARSTRWVTGTLVLGGLMGICIGTYGLLDATTPRALGLPMLLVGLSVAMVGLFASGARVRRTRYRPDPWRLAEWGVSGCGVAVAAVLYINSNIDPANLNPSLQPLEWPQLAALPTLGVLIGLLPAWIAPPPLRSQDATEQLRDVDEAVADRREGALR
jgi:energy-coupling factor transport system permease protein